MRVLGPVQALMARLANLINDPLDLLDPWDQCNVRGHNWTWEYKPDGSYLRCYCLRHGCQRVYWGDPR